LCIDPVDPKKGLGPYSVKFDKSMLLRLGFIHIIGASLHEEI